MQNPRITLKVNWHFGGISSLRLQVQRTSRAKRNKRKYIASRVLDFTLVSCSAYSSIVKTGTTNYSETQIRFERTARVPEDKTLRNHRCANLKSCMIFLVTFLGIWPPLWSSGQSSWLLNGGLFCLLWGTNWIYICYVEESDRLGGLVVRVLGYRSGGPGSIPGTTRFFFGGGEEKENISGSRTRSTKPREYNWGATWKEK
jgi:hypothetical protein